MERHEQSSHYVKRVVLPSGKTIEVVLFNDPPPPAPDAAAPTPAVEPHQELHVCAACQSELVYPVCWDEEGPDSWRVTVRCPECESYREGVFAQRTVDAFDERLDEGTDSLTADLRRLTRANMAEELERFCAALAVGAILPEDF